jgi:hypothetical protein
MILFRFGIYAGYRMCSSWEEKIGETGHVHATPVIVFISVMGLGWSSSWSWITELCSHTLFARQTDNCFVISYFHVPTAFS